MTDADPGGWLTLYVWIYFTKAFRLRPISSWVIGRQDLQAAV